MSGRTDKLVNISSIRFLDDYSHLMHFTHHFAIAVPEAIQ